MHTLRTNDRENIPTTLPVFFPAVGVLAGSLLALGDVSDPISSSTSRECCLDSSGVLGFLRFALWPPMCLLVIAPEGEERKERGKRNELGNCTDDVCGIA